MVIWDGLSICQKICNTIDLRRAQVNNRIDTYPKINGIEIEHVSEFKKLGVILDENLSWESHTIISSNKMSKYAGILNK